MSRVFVENSRALPLVTVSVVFRAGAVLDAPGKEGVARATARLLRRGAGGRSAEQIDERVDALGAELATESSLSVTSLAFEVIRRNLDPMVDLARSVLDAPTFAEDELARLLREARAEIVESRDSDRTLVGRAFRRALFEGHPYARRVTGSLASLENIRVADVRGYHERHLTRANAFVALSGDIEEDEARRVAERLLSGLPEGVETPYGAPEPTPPEGARLVIVDKPARTQTQMVVGHLGTSPREPGHTAFAVANTAFGGTFTSRLTQEIRAKRGWSYGASSSISFDRRRDTYAMWSAPKNADSAPCLKLELELLAQFAKEGITAEELAFVKSYLLRSHAFDIDTARKRAHQRLDEAVYDVPPGFYGRFPERVAAVTLEDAVAAARTHVRPDDLVATVVGTASEVERDLRAVRAWDRVDVVPFDLE